MELTAKQSKALIAILGTLPHVYDKGWFREVRLVNLSEADYNEGIDLYETLVKEQEEA